MQRISDPRIARAVGVARESLAVCERYGLTLFGMEAAAARRLVKASVSGGGREHWSGAYWGLFFGAGIRTGQAIGATDKQEGYPTTLPIDPKAILVTVYHSLGVDVSETTIPDRAESPTHLLPHGEVVTDMVA